MQRVQEEHVSRVSHKDILDTCSMMLSFRESSSQLTPGFSIQGSDACHPPILVRVADHQARPNTKAGIITQLLSEGIPWHHMCKTVPEASFVSKSVKVLLDEQASE